ncbi:hornerin-like [Ctenocephalides felis]|uniref:hornerin-like n=1 Tax=Ctenocephalides felis TaxID=7515 RepID=UPI000E6E4E4B|nr:hornerin-like [Ctenocephalides felis]
MLGRILVLSVCLSHALAWENLPQLPSNRRSQYYLQEADGGYKYGFDTGTNFFAKQSGNAQNQVEGHFKYSLNGGKTVDVKYTSGVQGFVPSGLDGQTAPSNSYAPQYNGARSYSQSGSGSGNADGSYSFSYNTGDSSRQESADAQGNVRGSYAYTNSAGKHDLSYVAGSSTGFLATGGSLSIPNGLSGHGSSSPTSYGSGASGSSLPSAPGGSTDGSYSFSYNTGDSSREESADSQNNVKGRYSYTNAAGTHDLSYVAGSQTGFLPTGGSLATPNGLGGKDNGAPGVGSGSYPSGGYGAGSAAGSGVAGPDGSYSFSYSTGDSSREESADSQNNVKGRYSYKNAAGHHDLSYVAGAQTGFLPTGGSLATPNGLGGKNSPAGTGAHGTSGYGAPSSGGAPNAPGADGSYSFSYNTGDSSREESADSNNNVRGRYSYTNAAGHHDLSYVAGAQTGFLPTGGSLATPNGLGQTGPSAEGNAPGSYGAPRYDAPSSGSLGSGGSNALSPDGSYSFSYKTGDSSREESADSQNNVKGRYSYTNSAGHHDLSYVAGAQTGFLPTGGSLATPNGLGGKSPQSPYGSGVPATYGSGGLSLGAVGKSATDGSYSFSYSTGDSSREESADSQNNVKGRYAYTNAAGHHDLSYVAGAATGFLPTGGSLATPNGLSGKEGTSGSGVTADSQNNVRGSYSYTNNAGFHDLSYVAGSQTGFLPTGGSLATPNGLAGKNFPSGGSGSQVKGGSSKPNSYTTGNVLVQTYLPPSNGVKFGYIFDSKL